MINMSKIFKFLQKTSISFFILIALGINGNGISLLFFGEPDYPAEEFQEFLSKNTIHRTI